jgi:hypothetical protein
MPKAEISRGLALVALMALSKKEFFQRLLDDPDAALADVQAQLELTPGEVAEVKSVVRDALEDITAQKALEAWNDWRSTGTWSRVVLWPKLLPFWPTRPGPDGPDIPSA